ncbi:acyltransferase family protein [Larsenimonas salina]|uniref:acyltransferase family protein n=1 Tax=Larsenimonas salina TaxID=1295565 RepID=UPI00207423EC|nr:acyltransferase [Larsenimonas salina]MCM5704971.1 acyltransferase [Larsenimonas salina]
MSQTLNQRTKRYHWMDALRGLAVFFVIFAHGIVTIDAKFEGLWPFLQFLGDSFKPFRMPILMLLSGLLVVGSIAKGGKRYFTGKAHHILYPYIVWTVVMFALSIAREILLGKESWDFFDTLLLNPAAHLWFIYNIMVYYAIAFLTVRYRPWLGIAFALVFYAITLLFTENYLLQRLGFYCVFFMTGALAGAQLPKAVAFLEQVNKWVATALFIAGYAYCAFYIEESKELEQFGIGFMIAFFAIIPGFSKLMMAVSKTRISPALEWVGRDSLPIYVLHFPLMYALPVLLSRVYHGDPNLLFFVYIVSILAVCMLVAYLARKTLFFSLFFNSKGWSKVFNRRKTKTSEAMS